MKKFNIKSIFLLIGLLLSATFMFNSCKDDDKDLDTPMVINKVFLENAQNSIPDREVTFVRLGQTIRLEGSGFTGVRKVYINGFDNYFIPVFVTDKSMIFQINSKAPTSDAPDNVRNTIRLEKSASNFLVYDFEIRSAAPSITNVSHTLAKAGEEITLTGTSLQEVEDVIFPGDIHATVFSSDNVDGKWCKVIVPEGINISGSITFIGANGGAYSAPYFNFKEGVVHNFDDVKNYSWGMFDSKTALTDVIPASGNNLPKSQGSYYVFNLDGNLAANGDQRFWLNSNAIFGTITNFIPGSTAAADCGMQFDIYVEGAWNSGLIRFVMADGSGASRYCMLYQPVYVDKKYDITAFENPGCWFTVTLPFELSEDYKSKTLDDVVASMAAASYKQAGPWFENSGITDVFDAVPATEKVYFDNIRFVPLAAPEYSDFPDEQ